MPASSPLDDTSVLLISKEMDLVDENSTSGCTDRNKCSSMDERTHGCDKDFAEVTNL
jgi:hypothetical protein